MPLSTYAPTIDASGITAPTYAEIFADLQDRFRGIFGADIYLEPDSQDGQTLGIWATGFADSNAAIIAAYNSFRPGGAQGVGLSSIVKINGLTRAVPTQSTATVRIAGTAGTVITNGVVRDDFGNLWNLPASVTIPSPAAYIDVTATAQVAGAIQAEIGTIRNIVTYTRGWSSVTNAAAATAGAAVEDDAELRQRQSVSTAYPSQTKLEGIIAGVAAVAGVAKISGFENDTETTNTLGLPPHSVALIVQGGTDADVAAAIAVNKLGATTYGTTSVVYTDARGVPQTINFTRPASVRLTMALTIAALPGFNSGTVPLIQQALADYVAGLGIGDDVYYSRLYQPAALGGEGYGLSYVVTALAQARYPAANLPFTDLVIAYNELATLATSDVAVTVT